MKDKNRVTQMFCAAADGYNILVIVILRSKVTNIFRPLHAVVSEFPIPCMHQNNVWFDLNVSVLLIF